MWSLIFVMEQCWVQPSTTPKMTCHLRRHRLGGIMLYQRWQNRFLKHFYTLQSQRWEKKRIYEGGMYWKIWSANGKIRHWESSTDWQGMKRKSWIMLKMPILNGLVKVEKRLSLEKKEVKLLFKSKDIFSQESQKRMVMRFPTVTKRWYISSTTSSRKRKRMEVSFD